MPALRWSPFLVLALFVGLVALGCGGSVDQGGGESRRAASDAATDPGDDKTAAEPGGDANVPGAPVNPRGRKAAGAPLDIPSLTQTQGFSAAEIMKILDEHFNKQCKRCAVKYRVVYVNDPWRTCGFLHVRPSSEVARGGTVTIVMNRTRDCPRDDDDPSPEVNGKPPEDTDADSGGVPAQPEEDEGEAPEDTDADSGQAPQGYGGAPESQSRSVTYTAAVPRP